MKTLTALQTRIVAAINATLFYASKHMSTTILQRTGGHQMQAGSFYTENTDTMLQELVERAEHGEVFTPAQYGIPVCTYVRIPMPGVYGMRSLDELPPDTKLVLRDEKATLQAENTEGAGVDAYLEVEDITGKTADYTILVLGPGDPGQPELVWTFHPGPLCPRPQQAKDPALHGKVVTPAEAKALGLTCAKVVAKK